MRKRIIKKSNHWMLKAFFLTLFISAIFSFLANSVLSISPVWVSCIIILLFISIGAVGDAIATAVTIADSVPFNSMASRQVKGGKTAIFLIQHADKVANICGDIIGDICAVISGGAVVILVNTLAGTQLPVYILMIIFSAFVSALTVGLKGTGKFIAIHNANEIINRVALFLCFFRREK